MSDKAEIEENKSTETECCTEDDKKIESHDKSDACKPAESASKANELSPDVCQKMDQVFNNELILNEIIKRMPVKDRINAKSVNSVFSRELNRRKFLQEEFIAFRGHFSSEEVEKLEPLGLLDRDDVNLTFINVESFENQPKEFWERWKVQKVRFKGCGINFKLLQQVLQNSYENLLEISAVGCYFDDSSGWKTRTIPEDDPLEPLFHSTDPPKRERGKILFHKNVEQFVRRFIRYSSNMFIYSDQGNVQTFVFEYPIQRHYIAFSGWNVEDLILYNEVQLDASPKTLPGWSTFRSYLETAKEVDEIANPRWVMIEIRQIQHLALQHGNPPSIAYTKDKFRR